ncbi:hypothetical protein GCM10011380_08410 [Sphingomonas metalli]|uniref:Ice-binding protein C-terminal domain-containing protein n=1 Tax=Sphingomonas metalli TaxID=1779358 RepID=A0A916SXS8_9SPHN|nr:PEPxxWA-CTERM sorting domain-containing protein [Sphingomonas metalli]GGB21117.1 hypothetical protein GCM10011380_08410 [Sphingomonas metalli]
MKTIITAAAALTAIAVAAPASATSFTFNTTTGGTLSGGDTYGNSRTYTTTSGKESLSVKATAWTVNDGKVTSSNLTSYSAGLGAIGRNESGAYGTHTVDNLNGDDFILLQFSQAVNLASATLNAYTVASNSLGYAISQYFITPDNDSTVKVGNITGAWNQALALNGISESSLNGMFTGTLNVTSNGGATQTFSLKGAGNLWMIGASQANPDCFVDGFKLAGLSVSTVAAVPEPATWAMMLVGFGMVGAASRYRRRATAVKVTMA